MLVLSRKLGQSIVISGRITITVSRIVGNRVALALEAPGNVHIRRGELPVHTDRISGQSDRPPTPSLVSSNETYAIPR